MCLANEIFEIHLYDPEEPRPVAWKLPAAGFELRQPT
jgi:hypothetical protein